MRSKQEGRERDDDGFDRKGFGRCEVLYTDGSMYSPLAQPRSEATGEQELSAESYLFSPLDRPSPAQPAHSCAVTRKHTVFRSCKLEIDDNFLLVEAFARVEADDNVPAELANEEGVVCG